MIDEEKRQKTLDEYLGKKRNDKISYEDPPSCTYCGRIDPLRTTCKYCGLKFCSEHRLPENHECKGLHLAKTPGDLRPIIQDVEHNLVFDVDIGLPDLKTIEAIPKLLFPFNEHYLTFAVAEDLENKGINVVLEAQFHVIKAFPVRVMGVKWWEGGFRERKTPKYPDIFLPNYGFYIEAENFYTKDLLKHFQEYSICLPQYNGCVLTWKSKSLPKSPVIYQANPFTNKVTIRVNPGMPYKKPTIRRKLHTWIQYELFKWERRLEKLCSVEIPVAMSGHIFLPDEIEVSRERIVGWKPEKFTQYSDWTHNGSSSTVPHEIPGCVDLCSYDGWEVSCFEIKIPKDLDLKKKKKASEVYDQLSEYMETRLFDRMWLVSSYNKLKDLWDETPEFFFNEVLPKPEIGILGYDDLRGAFKVIKEAEKLKVEKRELMSIKVLK